MNDALTSFFSFFTSLGDKLNGVDLENPDFVDYYVAYFQETSICSSVLWAGLFIALVIAVLFYYVICNKFYVLAKRYIWCIIMLLVCGITFATTLSSIVGNDNEDIEQSTCLFFNAHQKEAEFLDGTDDEDARREIIETAEDYRAQFKSSDDSIFMEESLPIEMSVVNGIAASILFLFFSLIITHVNFLKRYTIHGAGIPF